ncbi:MAG: hypothetical protein J3Q66DRAFT_431216, partial [Benniella sp.]
SRSIYSQCTSHLQRILHTLHTLYVEHALHTVDAPPQPYRFPRDPFFIFWPCFFLEGPWQVRRSTASGLRLLRTSPLISSASGSHTPIQVHFYISHQRIQVDEISQEAVLDQFGSWRENKSRAKLLWLDQRLRVAAATAEPIRSEGNLNDPSSATSSAPGSSIRISSSRLAEKRCAEQAPDAPKKGKRGSTKESAIVGTSHHDHRHDHDDHDDNHDHQDHDQDRDHRHHHHRHHHHHHHCLHEHRHHHHRFHHYHDHDHHHHHHDNYDHQDEDKDYKDDHDDGNADNNNNTADFLPRSLFDRGEMWTSTFSKALCLRGRTCRHFAEKFWTPTVYSQSPGHLHETRR